MRQIKRLLTVCLLLVAGVTYSQQDKPFRTVYADSLKGYSGKDLKIIPDDTLEVVGDLDVSGSVVGGTWAGTAVGVQYGGTGMDNSALASDRYLYTNGVGTFTSGIITSFGRSLIDDATASNARTTLGLGSLATLSSINNDNWSGTDLAVANGGTGASTLTGLLQGNGTGAITGGATINNGNWSGTDLSVTNGGNGRSSSTAYAVITGGTTSTGAHQSVSGVGTSGQVLTSNGASALPT